MSKYEKLASEPEQEEPVSLRRKLGAAALGVLAAGVCIAAAFALDGCQGEQASEQSPHRVEEDVPNVAPSPMPYPYFFQTEPLQSANLFIEKAV